MNCEKYLKKKKLFINKMNLNTGVLIFILCLLLWKVCFTRRSTIKYNIENFLIIHNYLKRCFYKVISEMMENKKHTIKPQMEMIENNTIVLSKNLTKALGSYVRGDEIFMEIKENLKENKINLYLFPDTLLQQINVDFYKMIIETVYTVLEKEIPPMDKSIESKVMLETLLT